MDPDLTSRRASRVAFDVAAVAAGSDGARASRLRRRPRPNRVVDDDGDDVAREAGCAVVASVEFRDARVDDEGWTASRGVERPVTGAAAAAAAAAWTLASRGAASAASDGVLASGAGGLEKYAIAALFFIAGVGLPVGILKDAAGDVPLNAFTQSFVFVFPVALAAVAVPELVSSGWVDPRTGNGLFILAALPTTVGSGVAFTRSADGNFSAALLNSLASNLAGIFLTPALIHAYLGADSSVNAIDAASKLLLEAFVPVVLGMSTRLIPGVAERADGSLKEPTKRLSDVILIGIVAKAFLTAEQSEAGSLDLTFTAHLLSVLMAFMVVHKGAIFLAASSVPTFRRRDVVSALYMGSHKTLAFGLPLITTTFEGDPNLPAYLLPLVLYHPMQILVSSLLVPALRRYVDDEPRRPHPPAPAIHRTSGSRTPK